ARPSIRTVHAPQAPWSQTSLVPVSAGSSRVRRTSSSVVRGSTLSLRGALLMESSTSTSPLRRRGPAAAAGPALWAALPIAPPAARPPAPFRKLRREKGFLAMDAPAQRIEGSAPILAGTRGGPPGAGSGHEAQGQRVTVALALVGLDRADDRED